MSSYLRSHARNVIAPTPVSCETVPMVYNFSELSVPFWVGIIFSAWLNLNNLYFFCTSNLYLSDNIKVLACLAFEIIVHKAYINKKQYLTFLRLQRLAIAFEPVQ